MSCSTQGNTPGPTTENTQSSIPSSHERLSTSNGRLFPSLKSQCVYHRAAVSVPDVTPLLCLLPGASCADRQVRILGGGAYLETPVPELSAFLPGDESGIAQMALLPSAWHSGASLALHLDASASSSYAASKFHAEASNAMPRNCVGTSSEVPQVLHTCFTLENCFWVGVDLGSLLHNASQ